MEEVPFSVTEEWVVGDLTDVQEQKVLVPARQNVKVRIANASIVDNENKDSGKLADLKGIKLEVKIVDGVPVLDKETGVEEMKYINKSLFTNGALDLCFWADAQTKTSNWFQTKQHLVQFKRLCQALDIPLTGISINDEFISGLIGRELLVDIQHEEQQQKDQATGKYVGKGTFRERLRNWKKAE